MRRMAALGVVGVALIAPAAARSDASVSLSVDRHVARYGSAVRFTGKLGSGAAGHTVGVYRVVGSARALVGRTVTKDDGTFAKAIRVRKPGPYVARAHLAGKTVGSKSVALSVRPLLVAHFAGEAAIGGKLFLAGKLKPRAAGALRRTRDGNTYRVRLSRSGAFRIKLRTNSARRIRMRLRLAPAAGYTAVEKIRRRSLRLPSLGLGSHRPAVHVLERRLREQRYALPSVDQTYTTSTVEAVWAFQKVHGLSRTGRVGPSLWRLLSRSKTPKAGYPHGNHLEISKARQVIFEVRKGKVVNVLHASTGATGNTPVGTFHVYYKAPGYNAKQMYYSLFFVGGFAIHGYHSVPPYPASHGCARIPLWAAHGLYNRWGYGTTVRVFG